MKGRAQICYLGSSRVQGVLPKVWGAQCNFLIISIHLKWECKLLPISLELARNIWTWFIFEDCIAELKKLLLRITFTHLHPLDSVSLKEHLRTVSCPAESVSSLVTSQCLSVGFAGVLFSAHCSSHPYSSWVFGFQLSHHNVNTLSLTPTSCPRLQREQPIVWETCPLRCLRHSTSRSPELNLTFHLFCVFCLSLQWDHPLNEPSLKLKSHLTLPVSHTHVNKSPH